MSTSELISWLAGAGALVLVSWFASWFLADLDAWVKLPGKVKQISILGVALIIGVIASWISSQPAIVAAIDPYIKAVVATVGAWLSTQVAYRNIKAG